MFIPLNPDDMPPELREQLAAAQHEAHMQSDKAAMEFQSKEHQMMGLIHSLDEEQLDALQSLLDTFVDPTAGPLRVAMHIGEIRSILHFKFGRCVCGRDHETLEDILQHSATGTEADERGEIEPEDIETLDPIEEARAKSDELHATYNVVPMHDGTHGVMCIGCGLTYVNLRDRMVKGPDDCHGCHQKSANG